MAWRLPPRGASKRSSRRTPHRPRTSYGIPGVTSWDEIVPEILILRGGSQLVQLPNVPPDPKPPGPIANEPTTIHPPLLTTTRCYDFPNMRLARRGSSTSHRLRLATSPHMSQAHFGKTIPTIVLYRGGFKGGGSTPGASRAPDPKPNQRAPGLTAPPVAVRATSSAANLFVAAALSRPVPTPALELRHPV